MDACLRLCTTIPWKVSFSPYRCGVDGMEGTVVSISSSSPFHPFTYVVVYLGSPTCGPLRSSHVGWPWRLSSSLPHPVHRALRATSDAIVSNRGGGIRQAHDHVGGVRGLCFGWMLLQRLDPSVHPTRSISCSSKCAKNLVFFFPGSSASISNCTFQGKLAEISFPL